MTEEERKKTILELEREVLNPPPEPKNKSKCEVCGEPLVKGGCSDHPTYVRLHQQYLNTMRKKYEK